MLNKKDEKSLLEEEFEEILSEKTEEAKPIVERPKTSLSKGLVLRKTAMRVADGSVYEANGDHYHVPEHVGTTTELVLDPDDKRIVLLYNWEDEINKALPTLNQIRDNVRKALWRNGALTKEHARETHVRRNLMRGAFPYTVEVD